MTDILTDLVLPLVTNTALAFVALYVVCKIGEAIADAFKGEGQ